MPWYRSGTVSITAGQTTVTGTGTNFSLNARVGDAFQGPDGRWYEVANIASATVMGILPAYQGATVAAGLYGLAPMQGYVKESADRLRQLVEQFGATLSLLGTPTDIAGLRLNIGAAALGTNSDITSLLGLTTALSVAQGGTGGKTPADARTGLGLKSAAIADVIGTISSTGTGAIFERGSNGNGEYTKFADGRMICTSRETYGGSAVANAGGSVFFGAAAPSRTYPAAFTAIPAVSQYFEAEGGAAIWTAGAGVSTATAWAGSYPFGSISRSSVNLVLHRIAVGRWY